MRSAVKVEQTSVSVDENSGFGNKVSVTAWATVLAEDELRLDETRFSQLNCACRVLKCIGLVENGFLNRMGFTRCCHTSFGLKGSPNVSYKIQDFAQTWVMSDTNVSNRFNELLQSSDNPVLEFLYENVVRPFADPIREKLLPDLHEEPGMMPLRTLVVDFEDTLCHLDWDREFGWRAVKRPGVDQFLIRAATAGYEVVMFSSGLYYFLEPMTVSIDPRGAIAHRLYRESTTFVGNRHVKDLSRLNRDLSMVIAVDDDPSAVEFQPENLVVVKPFTDKNDVTDRTLSDLIVMLEDFVNRDVKDIRVELARLRAIGHGDALTGFRIERQGKIKRADEAQNKGLGGVIRGMGRGGPHAAGGAAAAAAAAAGRRN